MATEFNNLSKELNYEKQAIWFTNGFYAEVKADMNKIYDWWKAFVELDKQGPTKKGADGNELDQFWSAKFLEDNVKALTALQRKEALKVIDVDNNGCMSMVEFLAWQYKKQPSMVAAAPQGDNAAAVAAAQKKMESVQKAMEEVRLAMENLKKQEARLAEEEKTLAKLKAELEAAIAELKAQQEAYDTKLASLDAIANDESASTVKKSKASNEAAQMRAEDPLPLRRAKITQEAALRKVEKQQKAVARQQEEVKAAFAAQEKRQVELEVEMQDAQKQLDVAKASGGGGKGALWWMQRGLFEADAYLPSKKQQWDHRKPFEYDP